MITKAKPVKKTSPDKLIETKKKAEIELKEDELKRVTGGGQPVKDW